MSEASKGQGTPPPEGDKQGGAMRATKHDRVAPADSADRPTRGTPRDGEAPGTGDDASGRRSGSRRAEGEIASAGGGGNLFGWLALLLAITALLGTGYLWLELQRSQRAHTHVAEQLQGSIDGRLRQATGSLERAQQAQVERIEALSEGVSRMQAEQATLHEHQAAIRDTLAELRGRLSEEVDALAIAEAEYLLTIASHRLQLTHDAATAMSALRSADDRLRRAADPAFTPVRQAIARELAELRAVPAIDYVGLAGRLAALGDRVDRLPLPGVPERGRPDGATLGELEREFDLTQWKGWERLAGAIWNDLKGLVTIRRDGEVQRPLAAPEERFFLRQNMQLKLASAQLALMQRDTGTYRSALADAAAWAERFFVRGSADVDAFIQEIHALAAETIEPEMPAIGQSLRLLRQVRGGETNP